LSSHSFESIRRRATIQVEAASGFLEMAQLAALEESPEENICDDAHRRIVFTQARLSLRSRSAIDRRIFLVFLSLARRASSRSIE
jgi:hypothetical protein